MKQSNNFKRHIAGFGISFVVFALLNILFKEISLFQGYVDFRISGLFPVAAGLFFGPAGALGCAAGNLVTDLLGNFSGASVFGAIAIFLFAYLPYRLWHTIIPLDNHKIQYISSTNSLLKYILVTIFSVIVSMSVLSAGCDLLGGVSYKDILGVSVLNNLYFSLFWGTTLFILLEKCLKINPYFPCRLYQNEYNHKHYIFDYVMCLIVGLLIIVRGFIAFVSNNTTIINTILNIAIIISALLLTVTPMLRSHNQTEAEISYKKNNGIVLQIVTVFFVFISVCTGIIFLMLVYDFFVLQVNTSGLDLMSKITYILRHVNFCGLVFLFVLILILKWIDKKVTKPIVKMAEVSGRFVENGLHTEMPDLGKVSDEVMRLSQSYNKMSLDILGYVQTVEMHAKLKEQARTTMDMASKIQLGILPKPLVDDVIDLASYIKPARAVGGDFYDYIKLDDDRILVCIADVSSKGFPAAMFMAEASILVKCNRDFSPEKILYNVNNHLNETNSENMFVSMFIGVIDFKKKVFEFANAGHNYPIIWNKGNVEWLETQPDLLLGLFPDINYGLHNIDIDDDFQLFMYTDGVNEAESSSQEFFGNDRLEELCKSLDTNGMNAQEQLTKIRQTLEKFAEGAEQSDDITMLMIKTTSHN